MLPLGLLLFFCVLMMHGFQASPSPVEMPGVPLAATSAGHADLADSATAAGGHHGGDRPADHHNEHPGGQICLAMLTMLVLFWAVLVLFRRGSTALVARVVIRVRILAVGRPPPRPSLHRLSVLRL
jgi:hypothetical protein